MGWRNITGEKAGKKFSLLYKPPPQPKQTILEPYLFFLILSRNEKGRNFGEHSHYLN